MARRKKHVTYDSKETLTIFGLICLILGVFFLLSSFITVEKTDNLFLIARNIFGVSTPLTSVFLFFLGARLLGLKTPFTRGLSLAAQLLLIFILPALITSFGNGTRELARMDCDSGMYGGQVGCFIVQDLMGETFPTEPATRLILFLMTLLALPIALAIPLSFIIENTGKVLKIIIDPFFGKDEFAAEKSPSKMDEINKASTFGDFNKMIKNKKVEEKNDKKFVKPEPDGKAEKQPKLRREVANVEIKEASVGEEGLKQENLKFPGWKLPPLSLLLPYKKSTGNEPAIDQNAGIIEQTLNSFGIEAKVEDAFVGASVIQYALNLPLGTKVEKVVNLSANLALALGVDSKAVRIESIPDTTFLGIEVPRTKREMVRFKEIMESEEMAGNKMSLPAPIGKNIDGSSVVADIQKMPHLLIAGATGSGKSVLTNAFISSILMQKTPDEVKLILVDPKQVELSDYNGIPHLLTPVITNMDQVVNALKWAVGEMERRYTNLAKEQVRNIQGYNEKKGFAAMPYIVVVIDEMADMMMTSSRVEAEVSIVRLAQKARAVGIHLILATQRPSVNVITGIIKANIPGRVGMSVTSSTDSRVILDRIGAESLLGYGDLLYKAPDKPKSVRLQSAFIDQQEVIRIVDFIKSQAPEVEYVNEILEKQVLPGQEKDESFGDISGDNLLEQAVRIVAQYQKGSSSFLQRRLNIGFNRAARLLEELEEIGAVGPSNGSKPREVLISNADEFLEGLKGTA